MAAKDLLTFSCVLIFVSCCVLGYPNSGINECNITLENKSCSVQHAMFIGGLVFLEVTFFESLKGTLGYTVFKQCAIGERIRCSNEVHFKGEKDSVWTITMGVEDACKLSRNNIGFRPPKNDAIFLRNARSNWLGSSPMNSLRNRFQVWYEVRDKTDDAPYSHGIVERYDSSQPIIQFAEDGIYVVEINASNLEITSEQKKESDDKNMTDSTLLEVRVIMRNPLGYLDAADYPYLVFYSLMFVGYFFLAIIWGICMCCSCKNLIRLQHLIGVVILLGFAEKMFFVMEYGSVNTTGERYTDSVIPLIIITETMSAGKKMFARELLIIISSGFGYNKLNTMNTSSPSKKPSLAFLFMLYVFGAVFFTAAVADGFVRTYYYNPLEGFSSITLITGIILVILDTICIFWIVSSLIRTRRTLKENNDHRLITYNYFCCTLVVISIAILAFLLWIFITTLMATCTQDWRGFWLRECFWPLLFTLLLVVIMILWRPSSTTNTGKVVYTAVPRGETKEMGMKDNFETMRMRHGSKSEGLPLNSDSEEDVIFFQ